MGLWDSIKKAATSAKCMAGLHAGEYHSIAGQPECNLEKTCPDCDKYLTKVEHKFGSWEYLQDKKCDSIRSCVYCHKQEESVRHQWVQSKSQCQVHKDCERCGTHELVRIEHGPWSAGVAHPDGMQTFICSGCGKTEERKFDPTAR